MPGHTSGHRVNGVLHGDAAVDELLGQFLERMLGASHCQAVAGHNDHGVGVGQQKVASSAEPDFTGRASFAPAGPAESVAPPKPPPITLKNERFIALHMM